MSDGLADALRAEYAAIYGYGVVGPYLSEAHAAAGKEAEETHRQRRDTLLEQLAEASAAPPAAEAAYRLPFPVTDAAAAVKLAVHLEEGCAEAWRAALPVTTGEQRKFALDALIDCAVRATRWRVAAGLPATVPFPGIARD